MSEIKGCLSTIVVSLIIAFLGIFAYENFKDNGVETLDTIGIDTEALTKFLTEFDYENKEVEEFLDSIGLIVPIEVYKEPTEYKPLLTKENTHFPEQPRTEADFRKLFLYMANQNLLEIEVHYPDSYKVNFQDSNEIQKNCSTAFDTVVVEYVDLFSGVSKADYKMMGNSISSSLSIKLSSQYVSAEELVMQQQYFEESAKQLNQQLYENNILNDSMTEKEKAEILFAKVTQNLAYDTDIHYESYTGYGAVKNKYAVCQGYTALYNYLLKLNNIYCIGQSGYIISDNAPHIWTVSVLDGETAYSDVTFGDPTPDRPQYTDYSYFNATKDFLSSTRVGVE